MMSRPLFEDNLEDGSFFFDAVEEHDVAGISALYDEDDEIFDHHDFTNRDDEGANIGLDLKDSIMGVYCKAVQERTKMELSQKKKCQVQPWLIQELKKNDWIIRRHRASYICNKLGIEYTEIAYYRDIHIWLPEERWGNSYIPPCPNCKTNCNVKPWSFPGHPARRIFTLQSAYYVMTRRYRCTECASVAILEPEKKKKPSQTFMGWDLDSLPLINFGRGRQFPAYLTHKSGIDKTLLDLLRALIPRGIRPETFSDIVTEMNAKQYSNEMIDREYLLASLLSSSDSSADSAGTIEKGTLFSNFDDKQKYNGNIPTGKYFKNLFITFANTIRSFQDNEVKKVPSGKIHLDTSYHVTKMVGKYHGESLFDGLFCGTGDIGHIRMHGLAHGEGHDQIRPHIKSFVDTQLAYGHPLPTHASTDKPSTDCGMLQEELVSLKNRQEELDLLQSASSLITLEEELPMCIWAEKDIARRVMISKKVDEINNVAIAMLQLMMDRPQDKRVLSLDTECDTRRNPATGNICWSGQPALLQIGYKNEEGISCAWLIQISALKALPSSLRNLLINPMLRYCGVWVDGDVKALEAKFECSLTEINTISLGIMARERGVVESGTASLDKLVAIVLKERLSKNENVRCSKSWSRDELEFVQKVYASLDAIKCLDIYFALALLPNLAARLLTLEAKKDVQVDIFPSSGSITVMASVAAAGFVKSDVENDVWNPPQALGTKQKSMRVTQRRRLVRVEKVFARNLKVPNLSTIIGSWVTLGDLADVSPGPFDVILPIQMLSWSIATRSQHSVAMSFGSRLKKPTGGQAPVAWIQPGADPPIREKVRNPYLKKRGKPGQDTTNSTTTVVARQSSKQSTVTESMAAPKTSMAEEEEDKEEEGRDESEESIDLQKAADVDYSLLDLSEKDVQWISFCMKTTSTSASMREVADAMECSQLQPPPEIIQDRHKSVTGDGFHFMDRAPVPVHHSMKKAYFVALMEAWYSWDKKIFDSIIKKLKHEGKSDDAIEQLYFFNTSLFLGCCPRIVPPPSILYWRVRAVFAFYGKQVCAHTGKPLFHEKAWKKANNVLVEILQGYASDVPGESYYRLKLNKNGDTVHNRLGLAMIESCRGTSDVEATHRQIRVVFRNWEMGVELMDCLLAEFRHRYNHKISERKLPGFPRIGHFDTWLIDLAQNLVARNHAVRLYPNWSNASDYAPTSESFGLVPMHSHQLGQAVNQQMEKLLAEDERKRVAKKDRFQTTMTNDMQVICRRNRLGLPFLPVTGEAEFKLFGRLVRLRNGRFDEDTMSFDWLAYCDGKTIFPKLPLYLRWHHKKWLKNEKTRATVGKASFRSGDRFLKKLHLESAANLASPLVSWPISMPNQDTAPLDQEGDNCVGTTALVIVGGISTTVIADGGAPAPKRSRGNRGEDRKPRKTRSCHRCSAAKSPRALTCAGNQKRENCQYYNEDGTEKRVLLSCSI
jgi:hypothetical protein